MSNSFEKAVTLRKGNNGNKVTSEEMYDFVKTLFKKEVTFENDSGGVQLSNAEVNEIIRENSVDNSSWGRFILSHLPLTPYYRKSMPSVRKKSGDELYLKNLSRLYRGERWE